MNKDNAYLKQTLNLAYNAIKKKDYEKGKVLLEEIISINSEIPEVYNDLGLLNLNNGELDLAIQNFKKALQIKNDFSLAYNNLGNAFKKKKDFETAIQIYQKAIKSDNKNAHAHYNLGILYFEKNKIKEAENYLSLAIKVSKDFFLPYLSIFELYEKTNQLDKLKNILEEAKNIFKKNEIINFFIGIYHFKRKNYYETIKILENVKLETNDVRRLAFKNEILAKSFDNIGSYNKSFKFFEEANNLINSFVAEKFDRNLLRDMIKKRIEYFKSPSIKNWERSNIKKDFNDPIFLIGFPRSGTTLLDTILRSHPLIEVLEEKPTIDKFIKYLQKKNNDDLSKLEKVDEDLIAEVRNIYFNERSKHIKFDSKKIYIDKMPLNIIHVGELIRFFPDSKFIFSLRNPYDVVLSCFMQNFTPNNAMINFFNLYDASTLYNLVMSLWEEYLKLYKNNIFTIKYEDVVNNFDKSIKELLVFLKLDWSDNVKEYYKTAKKRDIINTPSYNQVNMPIYKNSISRWKNYEDKFPDCKIFLDKWVKKFNY